MKVILPDVQERWVQPCDTRIIQRTIRSPIG